MSYVANLDLTYKTGPVPGLTSDLALIICSHFGPMSTHHVCDDRQATIELFPPPMRDAQDHAQHMAACRQELERLGVRLVSLAALTSEDERYRHFPTLPRPWYKREWWWCWWCSR
jgi:hypothetical protein